ncbi:MAG TPA: hypothetical protein VG755_40360 [Nannocystaceae bacterium]|nr:hypothetical protein [Nannocystaceae bacterium]
MRKAALSLAIVLGAACGTKQGTKLNEVKPPAPPAAIPETWDMSDASTLPAQRDVAMAACEWLLDVAPATANSKEWVRTRDFALDWIEASKEPEIPVVQPIVAYVATDRRFLYGVYMRGAYQCGKAKWVLANPSGDPLSYDAEVAGIAAMDRLMRALQKWDPKTYSRRLAKLLRKQKSGKLELFLNKIVAKAGKGASRKKK